MSEELDRLGLDPDQHLSSDYRERMLEEYEITDPITVPSTLT